VPGNHFLKGVLIVKKVLNRTSCLIVAVLLLALLAIPVFGGGKQEQPRKVTGSEVAVGERQWWMAPESGKALVDELPQPDKNVGPFVIAAAINDTEISFEIDVWNGFKRAAEQYPNVEVKLFDCKNNPDDSLKAVLDIQTLDPDLVVYFNWVGAGQEMARWCEANGVPEIEIDVPYGQHAWFYGVNNPMTGQLGGEKMGQWVKSNWAGKDIWVVQNTEYESGEDVYLRNSEFLRVFRETVGSSAKIKNLNKDGKVDELNGDTSPELGLQLFGDWLTAHPEAKNIVVWSMTDEAASGMYAAARNQNRLENVVFGSINGTPNAFNIIVEDKRYVGSIAIFPERYGEGVLKTAMLILAKRGDEVPKQVVTEYAWVTRDNLKQYYPKYFE
jgi:ribose transport system substrate-binding protein